MSDKTIEQKLQELKEVKDISNFIILETGFNFISADIMNSYARKTNNIIELCVGVRKEGDNAYFENDKIGTLNNSIRTSKNIEFSVGFGKESGNGWSISETGICRIKSDGSVNVRNYNGTASKTKYVFIHITYIL